MRISLRSAIGTLALSGIFLGWAANAAAQSKVLIPQPGYLVFRVNLNAKPGGTGNMPGGAGEEGYIDEGGESGFPAGPGGGAAFPGGGAFPGAGAFPGGGAVAPGGFGPGAATKKKSEFEESVVVVIPYKRIVQRTLIPGKTPSQRNPIWPAIQLETGAKGASTSPFFYKDDVMIQAYTIQGVSIDKALSQRYESWRTKGRKIEDLPDIIGDAISAGLHEPAMKIFDEMATMTEAKRTVPPSQRVMAAVEAFKKIKEPLNKGLTTSPDAESWRERLRANDIIESSRFSLVNFGENYISREALIRKLDLFENNFKAFYLWHALQGIPLPMPEHKLIAVVAQSTSDIPRLQTALDGQQIHSGSFYSPSHNIVVLAPGRMDNAGRAFDRYVKTQYKLGWNREDLLSGRGPDIDREGKIKIEDIARMMTLAMIDEALEKEGDQAAISRQGTRQLYASAGILSPYVQYPAWMENGAVNLMSKPIGPVKIEGRKRTPPRSGISGGTDSSTENQGTITVAIIPGYGAANYKLLREFKDLYSKKELNPDRSMLLQYTLMDVYFEAIKSGISPDPVAPPPGSTELDLTGPRGGPGAAPGFPGAATPGFPGGPGGDDEYAGESGYAPGGMPGRMPASNLPDPEEERRKLIAKLETKAQTTSWALIYYLAKTRPDKLYSFYEELNKMPRDMKIDQQQVLLTFCEHFDLLGSDKLQIDDKKFDDFAKNWLSYVNSATSIGVDIPLSSFKEPTSTGSGIPGMDGGEAGYDPFGGAGP